MEVDREKGKGHDLSRERVGVRERARDEEHMVNNLDA